ncbi:MAG: cyclic nucleotide-binding domain-containing protein [Candidatus Riflebacteria bacterium]|nr:cyclic nucleotide-binding domain-containing protein [Candidatus Riflebacteria bacterium]
MSVETTLKGHDLFRSLPGEQVAAISDFSSMKEFKKGELVCRYSEPATLLFLLIKGQVHLRLPASHGQHSLLISTVHSGYFIGLSALTGEERYKASAICAEPSSVLVIQARPFRELLRDNHDVGFQVMSQVALGYAERYHEVLARMQNIVNQIPLVV